jgi:H/ACA ribonucleoprotein complex subunit 4
MPGSLPADYPREILVKARETTNPEYGTQSLDNLPIEYLLNNGVVIIDKPAGPTSHEVAAWVRKILNVEKAGHSGTLDPSVTGILPVGLGNATRAMQALLPAGKEYVCVMEVHGLVAEDSISRILKEFTGKIYQRPPLRSSVKRVLRVREIYYNDLLEIRGRLVLFRVGCQAGTYIRKLCFDVGEALGVGAHMRDLRRTRVGKIVEDERLCTLHDLKDAYEFWTEEKDETYLRRYLLPLERVLTHLPFIELRDSAVDAICHGADLAATGIVRLSSDIKKEDLLMMTTLKGELVAVGKAEESSETMLKASSGIMVSTQRVLMERGRYPSLWKKRAPE